MTRPAVEVCGGEMGVAQSTGHLSVSASPSLLRIVFLWFFKIVSKFRVPGKQLGDRGLLGSVPRIITYEREGKGKEGERNGGEGREGEGAGTGR